MIQNLTTNSFQLLNGSLFIEIKETGAFNIAKAFVTDNSWNFIIPKVSINNFPLDLSEMFIQENKKDRDFSYYLSSNLHEEYKDKLTKIGYRLNFVDTYIGKEIKDTYIVSLNDGESFEEVTESTLDLYLDQAKKAFPKSNNEDMYVKYFYELNFKKEEKQFKNFVIKNDQDILSFGSVIYSKELNLAYFHNSGTNENYIKQGYFSNLNKLTCNYVLGLGITNVYALVEENGGSYHAFQKIGFDVQTNYYVYSK